MIFSCPWRNSLRHSLYRPGWPGPKQFHREVSLGYEQKATKIDRSCRFVEMKWCNKESIQVRQLYECRFPTEQRWCSECRHQQVVRVQANLDFHQIRLFNSSPRESVEIFLSGSFKYDFIA